MQAAQNKSHRAKALEKRKRNLKGIEYNIIKTVKKTLCNNLGGPYDINQRTILFKKRHP